MSKKKSPTRRIVAIGGSGFRSEPYNLALERYLILLTGKVNPRVLFIPTASGDSDAYVLSFLTAFKRLGTRPSVLSLFRGDTPDLASRIIDQDLIYVGGGNTRSMLSLWREWNIEQPLKQAYESGTVMAGVSAGGICWFEQGLTDSIPQSLNPIQGLGWLKGSFCPHFDVEPRRQDKLFKFIESGAMQQGYSADDHVGLLFENEVFQKAVTSHPHKNGYQIQLNQEHAVSAVKLSPESIVGDDVIVRRATLKDSAITHDVHMQSIQKICSSFYSAEEISAWGGRPFDKSYRDNQIHQQGVFIVEQKNKALGVGQIDLPSADSIATIRLLYLLPEALGRGLGKALLRTLFQVAIASKAKQIHLHSTLNAVAFYEAEGFIKTGPISTMMIQDTPIRAQSMSRLLRATY